MVPKPMKADNPELAEPLAQKVARLVYTIKALKLDGNVNISVRNTILLKEFKFKNNFFNESTDSNVQTTKLFEERIKTASQVAKLLNNYPEKDEHCLNYMITLKEAVNKALEASTKFGAERNQLSKGPQLDKTTRLLAKIENEINKEFPDLPQNLNEIKSVASR